MLFSPSKRWRVAIYWFFVGIPALRFFYSRSPTRMCSITLEDAGRPYKHFILPMGIIAKQCQNAYNANCWVYSGIFLPYQRKKGNQISAWMYFNRLRRTESKKLKEKIKESRSLDRRGFEINFPPYQFPAHRWARTSQPYPRCLSKPAWPA